MTISKFAFQRLVACHNRREKCGHLEVSYRPHKNGSAEIIVEVFFLGTASDQNSLACGDNFVDIRVCHDQTQDLEVNHTRARAQAFVHAYNDALSVAEKIETMALAGHTFDDVLHSFNGINALPSDSQNIVDGGFYDWAASDNEASW